jgi:hypothetical protein
VAAQTAWLIPTRFDSRSDSDLVERAGTVPFDHMAAACSDWKSTGIDKIVRESSSPFGRYSIVASYEAGREQIADLEIDYPFFGWHSLESCYALKGWEVRSGNVLETRLPGQQPGNTLEQFLTKGIDGRAFLLYSIHDSDGRILKRPEKYLGRRWLQAHVLSPRGLNIHLCSLFNIDIGEHQVFSAEPEWYVPTLQVQMFVQGLNTLEDAKTLERAHTYFDNARNILLRELSRAPENKQ